MKPNLVTLIFGATAFAAGLWARQTHVAGVSAHMRYYTTALLVIGAALTGVALLRFLRPHSEPASMTPAVRPKASARDRQRYRLGFNEPPRPIFIQNTGHDSHPVPAFTCPVHDVSETGVSLACNGVYAQGQAVQGEIIFGSGRTAPINGRVIREESGRTCLHLDCTIDPPLLMTEQRERISTEKATGPRPAVSRAIPDRSAGPLPSHSPRGVFRIKRP